MFQRNIYKKLQDWASKSSHKPPVLRGARQVGKTTLVNEFSKGFQVGQSSFLLCEFLATDSSVCNLNDFGQKYTMLIF